MYNNSADKKTWKKVNINLQSNSKNWILLTLAFLYSKNSNAWTAHTINFLINLNLDNLKYGCIFRFIPFVIHILIKLKILRYDLLYIYYINWLCNDKFLIVYRHNKKNMQFRNNNFHLPENYLWLSKPFFYYCLIGY